MKIVLDNEWTIEDDGNGFTLTQEVMREVENKETGEKTMKLVQAFQNYPSTLEGCLKHYVRRNIVDKHSIITLAVYVESINEKYDELLKAIKGE